MSSQGAPQRNPRALSSSNLSHYKLEETEEGYTFTTLNHIIYEMIFRSDADYFPEYDFAESIVSFSLTPVHAVGIPVKDVQIERTVMYALSRTFEANPETILAFTCSTEDDLERHRRILFGRWYQRNGRGYTRLTHNDAANKLYTAVIYRDDHPDREQINAIFVKTYTNK